MRVAQLVRVYCARFMYPTRTVRELQQLPVPVFEQRQGVRPDRNAVGVVRYGFAFRCVDVLVQSGNVGCRNGGNISGRGSC